MPLVINYWRNDRLAAERRLDWLPRWCDQARLQIMVDPTNPPIANGWVQRRWEGHDFYFCVPHGEVKPVHAWQQTPASDARYPYFWNLCETYSNCDCDLAVQILPAGGETSHHFHRATEHELFLALAPDGATYIRIADQHARPLGQNEEMVCSHATHQLFRLWSADDFSIQLLRMKGPVRFPDLRDHYCVKQAVAI